MSREKKKYWKARKEAALALLNCRGNVQLTRKDKQGDRNSKECRKEMQHCIQEWS